MCFFAPTKHRTEGRGSRHWDITHDEKGRRRGTKEQTEENKHKGKKKQEEDEMMDAGDYVHAMLRRKVTVGALTTR
jgi:hypothetical protein